MKLKNNVFDFIFCIIVICLTNLECAKSQCNESQWKCDDGECISDDGKCNGTVDCRDRSDEVAENCIQDAETCPSYAFKCLYGACIAGKAQCNNRQDCADNSDELICSKITVEDIQGKCSEDEMQCVNSNSNECIKADYVCDGKKHCSDGSDETVELCIGYGCNSQLGFQCGYGACIHGNAKCNGSVECADGSDEAWDLCKYPRNDTNRIMPTPTRPITVPKPSTTTSTQCQIPKTFETTGLIFTLHPSNYTVEAGSSVDVFETIHVRCNNGLILRGSADLYCRNGTWNYEFPSCLNHCKLSRIEGLSTRAICNPRYNFGMCKQNIPPNTEIQINCAPGYTNSLDGPQYLKCLPNGSFDKERKPCYQKCGTVASPDVALSRGGVPTNPSKAPWHVAIYEGNTVDYIYSCSGSIISPRVIISAAHCFWDEPNQLKKNNKFQIIAGKNNKNYPITNEDNAQIIDVDDFHISKNYKGTRSEGGSRLDDFAIIILKDPLQYNENISSICIPSVKNAQNYVLSNLKGFITGFGDNNQLERLNMLTLSYHDCSARSTTDSPIASDKFCIYTNDGSSVCRGDSGGGYVRETTKDSPGGSYKLYNLFGIISSTPHTINDCTREDTYVAVTSIHYVSEDLINKALQNDTILF